MGKNTSSVLNQNPNNIWSSISTTNSDWIKNEGKYFLFLFIKDVLIIKKKFDK